MDEAAAATDVKRNASEADPAWLRPRKRSKTDEERDAKSAAHANASSRECANRSLGVGRPSERDDQLRDLLALLKESEQQMRRIRGDCHADTEAFSSKCGSVLQDISKLLDLASGCPPKCMLGIPHDSASVPAWPKRFADMEWFREVATAIDVARDTISKCKAELTEFKMRADNETEKQEVPAAGGKEGAGRVDLLAAVQQTGCAGRHAARFQQASDVLLDPANEAGSWACAAFRKLMQDMCAHDDALVRMRQHAAKQFETHGNAAIAHGDKLLQEGGERGVSEALAWFVQAKAAYDEVQGMKPFSGQRAPAVPCPDFAAVASLYFRLVPLLLNHSARAVARHWRPAIMLACRQKLTGDFTAIFPTSRPSVCAGSEGLAVA